MDNYRELKNRCDPGFGHLHCIELFDECVAHHGAPEIINTDQGTQYMGLEWKQVLERHGIRMSMDGRGRCKDNIWIERFWRTIKQEYIYQNPADNGAELRAKIAEYILFITANAHIRVWMVGYQKNTTTVRHPNQNCAPPRGGIRISRNTY